MTRLGKTSFFAGCFLLSGLVANGQDAGQNVEPQSEYPSTERYELGYVQPGKEQLCNRLLTDYEEYAPDRMDEYYKSDRFVQWTSGESSARRYDSLGSFLDSVHWVYVPIFNDGEPILLVRFADFEFPFRFFDIYPSGHILARDILPFDNGSKVLSANDVKRAYWVDRLGTGNKEIRSFVRLVLSYYVQYEAKEGAIIDFMEEFKEEFSKETLDDLFLRQKESCPACDFSEEKVVTDRRRYLFEKGFFKEENEIEALRKEWNKLTDKYPFLLDNVPSDEVVNAKPKWVKPKDFNEINIIYHSGNFYVMLRKTQSDVAVVFNFPEKDKFEEVCYIGSKEKHEINLGAYHTNIRGYA